METIPQSSKKFNHPKITASGAPRASVPLLNLETLWFNTGTQCNLNCDHCYIESSPKNDSLSLIGPSDVLPYFDEIQFQNLAVKEIGFTGGEPFLNPHIIEILKTTLDRGYKTIVLTNAYRLFNRFHSEILELSQTYGSQFLIRVSLDHFSQEIHEGERGSGTFLPTLKNLTWLSENQVTFAIAGRILTQDSIEESRSKYQQLFSDHNISIDLDCHESFVLFPEMNPNKEVPEITTSCWKILNKKPTDLMCSNSRMIVKRKGQNKTKVLACTLLAYDKQFELGESLAQSKKSVSLNHPFCAQFCVLGGASCS